MQSGISASRDLQNAFNTLVSDSSQRALLAGIENETLVPLETIPLRSSSSFTDDLGQLQGHLSANKAAYILLKTHPGAPDGYAAVTFVPNAAPVRQKMLFASTRLTLVRELGIERFRETLFATEKSELTPEGWAKHEKHTALDAPLTEEEAGLAGVKEAEAQESQGTGARRGHVTSKVDVKTGEGVQEALSELMQSAGKGTVVQLTFALPDETLRLHSKISDVTPADFSSHISQSEPRYTFYSYPGTTSSEPQIVFLYTCPTGSRIKERMVYSTGKSWTRTAAEKEGGIVIAKSLEATEPNEITAEYLAKEFGIEEIGSERKGFARPKRPGRR